MVRYISLGLLFLGAVTVSCVSNTSQKNADKAQSNPDRAGVETHKPLALIYQGEGSCPQEVNAQGCSEAAADMAVKAGFDYVFVGPQDDPKDLFAKAQIWIQPGGRAKKQVAAMTDNLKKQIVDFVNAGGGYVGFCAGGFLATEKFGWDMEEGQPPFEAIGLGLIKGKSFYYTEYDKELTDFLLAKIIPTNWNGAKRFVYWELGPYFTTESYTGSEARAFYLDAAGNETDKAMTIYSAYGAGKVAITAVHPEGPNSWRNYYKINDPDQEDFDLAVDMIMWAKPL